MGELTLGQYYPVDSVIHRMDPRTKLFGTMIFIIALFLSTSDRICADDYFFAVKCIAFQCSNQDDAQGLRAIIFLLLISVSFNLFLTPGDPFFI